ncbi:hypothetical protein RUND412_011388 [Rhizina undulata]
MSKKSKSKSKHHHASHPGKSLEKKYRSKTPQPLKLADTKKIQKRKHQDREKDRDITAIKSSSRKPKEKLKEKNKRRAGIIIGRSAGDVTHNARSSSSARGSTTRAVTPRSGKVRKEQEHPLARAFGDSLSLTTAHLRKTLPQLLEQKLHILLSRTTSTTFQSRTYLESAEGIKNSVLKSSPFLREELNAKVGLFRAVVEKCERELEELWEQWGECVQEFIEEAEKKEVAFNINDKGKGKAKEESDDEEGGEQRDVEMERILEEVTMVGEKWVEKMTLSEKKITEDEQKQQQLAAAVLL